MLLLLDGYNILKKIERSTYIHEAERNKFIKKLNNYAHKKHLEIILVFDGGLAIWPFEEKVSTRLTVIYSGTNQSADEYIKDYLELHHAQETILVSSDREIIKNAAHYNIPSLDSYQFIDYLLHAQTPEINKEKSFQSQAYKLTSLNTDDIDALMEQLNPKIKPDSEPEQKSSKNQLSKHDRQLLKKIKKL